MLRFQAGAVLRDNAFYIERPADGEIDEALAAREFLYVLAPRQIGKSSLCLRAAQRLGRAGHATALVDLSLLGTVDVTADDWCYSLAARIAVALGLPEPEEFWDEHMRETAIARFARYLKEVVLAQVAAPVILFFDEIDTLQKLRFGNDVLAALRGLYQARETDAVLGRLSFCLIGVAAPADLIDDPVRTPFNIGRGIRLEDFTRGEMDGFARGLEALPGSPAVWLDAVHDWTDGHPYMTQVLLEQLVLAPPEPGVEPVAHVAQLAERTLLDRGVEEPNLGYALARFEERPQGGQEALAAADPVRAGERQERIAAKLGLYRRVLQGERVVARAQDRVQLELRLAGMVKERRRGGEVCLVVRNRVFALVFGSPWVREREVNRQFRDAVERWIASGRSAALALRGEALDEALQWTRGRSDIAADEREFLTAGQEQRRIEEKRQAQLDRARLLRVGMVALGVLAVLLGVALVRASRAEEAARKAQAAAEKDQAQAETARGEAEHEKQRAEAASESERRQREEAERAKDEAERRRQEAETERRRAEGAGRAERRQRQRAESQEKLAEANRVIAVENLRQKESLADQIYFAINDELQDLIYNELQDIPNAVPVQGKLLNAAGKMLTRMRSQGPYDDTALRRRMIIHLERGAAALSQENTGKAEKEYHAVLVIAQRLTQKDPLNTQWQRDLSVSHERLGEVLVAQGQLDAARDAFQKGLVIRERLTQTDPANTQWQRDLSVSHERLGEVLVAQGQLDAARDAFQKDLAIAQRLAQANPANTELQSDLLISHVHAIDFIRRTGGSRTEMAMHLRSAEEIVAGFDRERAFAGNPQVEGLRKLVKSFRAELDTSSSDPPAGRKAP